MFYLHTYTISLNPSNYYIRLKQIGRSQIFALGFRHFIGEGNGIPLQYSCLENPMDGGAWWAAVHGVAESRTRLSDFTFTAHFSHFMS